MRKTAAALITALLITAAAGTQFVESGSANPWVEEFISPPRGTEEPSITIVSPKNNTLLSSNYVPLRIIAKLGDSNITYVRYPGFVMEYWTDWNSNKTYFWDDDNDSMIVLFLALTDIPDGNHTLTVYATEYGRIVKPPKDPELGLVQYFQLTTSQVIDFTVDATPPTVSVLQIENQTYTNSTIALNFTVNESSLKMLYLLDGQKNVTVNGNATLTGLSIGKHNITVYVWDFAGNMGTSKDVFFTIAAPEPELELFPLVPVAAAVVMVAVVAVAVSLVYFRRRKGRS